MTSRALVTGGAGFIGSHLSDALLAQGYRVRVLDSLVSQVHGAERRRPAYLAAEVELQVGDVRDPEAVRRAPDRVDAVFHCAALVGVGQSMYQIAGYTDVNVVGTATLLEALAKRPVERLIVASSMSLYGEGLYRRADGAVVPGPERTREQLRAGEWEVRDEQGCPLIPVATPETKLPALASVYALSKFDQERLCLILGRVYGIPAVALRFFNTYGTRQALSNPYTGVLAIFASRLLNGNRPSIFEDGLQRRDFVSVHDITQACMLALQRPQAIGEVFNVGSGHSYTVREIAARIARVLGRVELEPEITGTCRALLGYEPKVALEDGLDQLAEWLEGQTLIGREDLRRRARDRARHRAHGFGADRFVLAYLHAYAQLAARTRPSKEVECAS